MKSDFTVNIMFTPDENEDEDIVYDGGIDIEEVEPWVARFIFNAGLDAMREAIIKEAAKWDVKITVFN